MAKRSPYFQFQQFAIYHDKCAMKVGTDGTILGAWADVSDAKQILDVGTGSGLIALMAAQKNKSAQIVAIDIEESAIIQTNENIARSPFANRVTTHQVALQNYCASKKFDVIISNPPFFTETLKSPDKLRATARHADSLSAEELICFSSQNINTNGRLSLIYPSEYREELLLLAKKHNLFATKITNLYPTPQSLPKRILLELSKEKSSETTEDDLVIELERHVYSEKFKNLVRDFYLQDIAKNI